MNVNLSMDENSWVSDDTDPGARAKRRPTVALVVPAGSYRTADFVDAARALRVELVVATDGAPPMGDLGGSRSITIDFDRTEWSAARIAALAPAPDAVIAADDRGVVIAALASSRLSIPSNPVAAVSSTRDKAHMRGLLESADVPQPRYALAGPGEVPTAAAALGYPCVVKPRSLSASQGVIRVDDSQQAEAAEKRIREIVRCSHAVGEETLLVESFVSGPEVAVEAILVDGNLIVLAILDKPDPLEGPYFEETMFVTPSRLPDATQKDVGTLVQASVMALGLVTGPVHAEVRIGSGGPVLVEVAARSIGGLCGRSLSFGLLGESLELLIMRSALGMPGSGLTVASAATGVVMLPIPRSGVLEPIDGIDAALRVEGITEFSQTIAAGRPVVPLPEGDRYLGFLFAEGLTPMGVEESLRAALREIHVRVV